MKNLDYCIPQNSKTFYNNINDILCDIKFIKKGRTCELSNLASVFDIEASSFYKGEEKQCCMYVSYHQQFRPCSSSSSIHRRFHSQRSDF